MATEQASSSQASNASLPNVLLDGLFTGMIGALAVALWFLVLDLIAGQPLRTPALLGSVLLHGTTAVPEQVIVAPLEVAAYTAFHFVAFITVGILFSYLMTVFDRFPIMFFVIIVFFGCLQVGFFAMDAALGARLMGRLQPWSVIVANILAATSMAFYQWKRHPGALKNIDRLWQEE